MAGGLCQNTFLAGTTGGHMTPFLACPDHRDWIQISGHRVEKTFDGTWRATAIVACLAVIYAPLNPLFPAGRRCQRILEVTW